MPGQLPEIFVGLGMLTLLAHAAWTDIRSRRIANGSCAGLVALWLVCLAVTSVPMRPLASIQVALAIFAVGALLWGRGWLGGGDVKLLAATGLWAGPSHGLTFLLATALAGGGIALLMMWHARHAAAWHGLVDRAIALWLRLSPGARRREPRPRAAAASASPSLPYGVAVAIGGGIVGLRLLAA